MSTSKNVVITGSTRGIGFGLADAFLARGCRVVVSGRAQENIDQALETLRQKYEPECIAGSPCDVTSFEQVQSLWDYTCAQFGIVDIWINNAGSANILANFWDLEPLKMEAVVNTNILGSMYGAKVAIKGMLAQGSGSLYNMEGFGSRGKRRMTGMTLYGTTKAAVAFLNDSLIEETRGTPVVVGSLSPGMVVTDLLLNQRAGDPADWERSKRVFNILADRVETVAPWLVERILANEEPQARKHGIRITRMNTFTVMARFLSAPFNKRKVIEE
jgi:NAD(P)-dependent dehydrogenase (short-subunit alcohol dehydrogenase family)